MADKRNPPEDERDSKRQKTHTDCHGEDDRVYKLMLDTLGQCFTKEDARRLARLAGLSTREIDGLFERDDCFPGKLIDALDRKNLISQSNLMWLENALRDIGHEKALSIVKEFSKSLVGELCAIPSEPDSDTSDESGDGQSRTFSDFLAEIGLGKKFPQKLTLNSFLKVKDKVDPDKPVEIFWQKLTSLDYRAGYPQQHASKSFSMRDFIFSVLQCADDFLRQDILEKMAACQLAVPIVLQGVNENKPQYLLWGMRRIIKKWKGNRDSHAIELPIATYPVFTVSMLRIGDVRVSKSHLLNTMLCYSQGNSLHSFFLSMEKDIVKPHFSLGSIECVWYLPQRGNDEETFHEVTTFLNLRGDCSKYFCLTEFACKAANLTIALVATEKREKYHHIINLVQKSSTKAVFVSINEEDKQLKKPRKVHNPRYKDGWFFVKVLQVDVLSRHICAHISSRYQTFRQYKSLESVAKLCNHDIEIDEDKQMCKDAKGFVSDIFESARSESIIELKKRCFPLQKYWADIIRFEREPIMSDTEEEGSVAHHSKTLQVKKVTARENQIQSNLSEPVKSYHNCVSSHKDNSSMLKYILGYLQEEIYNLVNTSTKKDNEKIIELETQIDSYRKRVSQKEGAESCSEEKGESKLQRVTEPSYKKQQYALKSLLKECKSKHLGCEHFLRELGQLFEAFTETREQERYGLNVADIALLPALATRLVIEMYSLELMDGDTGSVPLIWITNVLDTLTRTLGDAKILVVSAIGVQSSGKSTLLNSMFGLKFPVRAGRCTRGLFIRLLKLEESLAAELGLNYFVIVDTEGIHSIEQDSRRFDNELVTLALSIANITIFNIEGENIGPDMTGILQIAAHALMRMKEVDIECQCRIVQQRVSDLTAASRNKANNDRIMETLDEATKIAAQEEGLSGRYQTFQDVVKLHVDEGLQYIPCLWSGGMAPPNHKYSDIVTKIKGRLIQDIRDGNVIPDMTLSTFTERLRDVWAAVKKEDFVFNFQDSVKAVDFNQLCLQCNEWVLDMRHHMMLATKGCFTSIKNIVSQCEGNKYVISTEEIGNTTTVPNIRHVRDTLRNEAEKREKCLIGSIQCYIDKHPRRHTLSKYREGFIRDFQLAVRDVENDAWMSVQDEYELCKMQHDLPKFRHEWRIKLSLDAKQLATVVPDKVKDIKTVFEKKWEEWMSCIANSKKHFNTNISLETLQVICEKLLLRITRGMAVGSEVKHLITEEGGIDKHTNLGDCSVYIHDKIVKAWLMQDKEKYDETITKCDLIEFERIQAVRYAKAVISKNLSQVVEEHCGKSLDTNLFQMMLQRALKELSERPKLKLPYAMIAKCLLHLSCTTFHILNETKIWKTTNFCTFWLKDIKNAVFQDFRAFQTNDKDQLVVRAAQSIYDYIESIYNKKAIEMLEEKVLSERKLIGGLKVQSPWDFLRLSVKRRTPLTVIRSQHKTVNYVRDITQLKIHKVKEMISGLMLVKYKDLVNDLMKKIDDTDCCTPSSGAFEEWLTDLSNKVGCKSLQDLSSLYVIDELSQVTDYMKRLINERLLQLLSQNVDINMYLFRIIHLDFTQFCLHTCPLCGVQCDNLVNKHNEHYSFLHRPRGFKGEVHPKTKKLITEDCFASVRSKAATFSFNNKQIPCHQYQQIYPDWRITPTSTNYGLTFWQWSMVRDNEFLAMIFECRKADIPESWYSIDEETAVESLDLDQSAKINGRHAAASKLV